MQRYSRRPSRKAGFTLMELVVVMTIIAILAGAITLQVYNNIKTAKRSRALSDIKTLETAVGMYQAHNGFPPSQQQGLAALIAKPSGAPEPLNWQGPYLKAKSVPKDPWGNDYNYVVNGDDYEISSTGDGTAPVTTEEAN